VTLFTSDQWLIVALIFLLGLVVGMALMAGGKWKKRYKEESRLRQDDARQRKELEAENARLRKEAAEMDSLRHAAARSDRRDPDGPGPL
jgi:hypothetical protein